MRQILSNQMSYNKKYLATNHKKTQVDSINQKVKKEHRVKSEV